MCLLEPARLRAWLRRLAGHLAAEPAPAAAAAEGQSSQHIAERHRAALQILTPELAAAAARPRSEYEEQSNYTIAHQLLQGKLLIAHGVVPKQLDII
jgi:hypothetical protein